MKNREDDLLILQTGLSKALILQDLKGEPRLRWFLSDWDEGIRVAIKKERIALLYRTHVQNSFQKVFYATLEEKAGKTEIRGSFRIAPYAKWIFAVWFALAAAILITACIVLCMEATALTAARFLPVSVSFLLLVGIGTAGVAIGRRMGRKQEAKVLEYLQEKFAAYPVKPYSREKDGVAAP